MAKSKRTDQTLATNPPGGKNHNTKLRDEDRLPSEIGRTGKSRSGSRGVSSKTVAKAEK